MNLGPRQTLRDPRYARRQSEYDACGNRLADYSTLAAPRHGFVGAEADEAAGTYTFGARTYDPTLRRWVSPDPLLAAVPALDELVGDNLNLYAYVGNKPGGDPRVDRGGDVVSLPGQCRSRGHFGWLGSARAKRARARDVGGSARAGSCSSPSMGQSIA